ncbi:MAG TPA: hypothetical protein VHO69_13800, partial [Phototrophicaceae bacterium]|nr:hypothetical protein [Phototrophicaceae bacterium]
MASTTPDSSRLRRAGILVLVFFAGLLILILVLLAVFSPPITVNVTEGQAQISFSANRSRVLLHNNCVTVNWEVEGIQTVLINTLPTVGTGQQEMCVTPEQRPTLLVTLVDGSEREYQLDIQFFERQLLTWLLAVPAGLLLLGALLLAVWPRLSPVVPRLKVVWKTVEITGITVIVIVVGLELGLRFYFTNFGTERERIKYLYSAEEIKKIPQIVEPMPYVNYVASPTYEGHNRLGYRGPEITLPKPEGVFRIVTLGGSTTYSSATDSEHSYPNQLQKIL